MRIFKDILPRSKGFKYVSFENKGLKLHNNTNAFLYENKVSLIEIQSHAQEAYLFLCNSKFAFKSWVDAKLLT